LDLFLDDPGIMALPKEVRDPLLSKLSIASKSLLQAKSILSGNKTIASLELTKQDIWERKLLDLSFRNSLLHIRLGQRAVEIETSDIEYLNKRLCDGDEVPVEDILVSLNESDRKRLIKGLYRFARTSLDESGANTLFLAFGVLCYIDERTKYKVHRAPILLFPVELIRCRKDSYVLRKRDEDQVFNITLIEYLKQVVGIDIPSNLQINLQESDVGALLDGIRKAVVNRDDWKVEEKCVLGVFSFTKFVLWNDIRSHHEVLSSNPLLKSLIEGRLSLESPTNLDPRAMDLDFTPDHFALPMDYDSSQFEAVAESDRGSSFILYGPPGTGKSQTITNIISNSLYKGKRVLFVAEKQAALEVVRNRMERIGLGPFCLELHGNKVEKRSFLLQMERILSYTGTSRHEEFKKSASELYSKRIEIIKHIDALHSKGESDWSLSECIEGYLSIQGPYISLPQGWTIKRHKADIESVRRLCLALEAGPSILGISPAEHPLYGMRPKKISDSDKKNLINYLKDLSLAIETAEKQESSDMNRKFLKKSALQILFSDYRWRKVIQLIEPDKSLLGDIQVLRNSVEKWGDSMDLLPVWQRYLEPFEALRSDGLDEAVSLYNSGLSGTEVYNAFLKGFYLRAAQDKIDGDRDLSRFNGLLFSQVIESYRKEAAAFQRLTSEELAMALASRIVGQMRNPLIGEELTYLKKRIASKGRGTTVRGIMERIPNLMRLLSPCMLMSPLSVAQFLPIDGQLIDVVVFDEASQIPTSEAVGAIARGRSVIIVGDPKQMPPTDFFSAGVTDEEEYEVDDLDSILDDCIALSLPAHHLRWHYRSRHESLIAFSNKEYYDGSLVTFPSVDNQVSQVIHRHVDGVYDFGKTRHNLAEAKEIVSDILDRLSKDDPRSLGVVAFSKNQSDLIEDLLLEALSDKPILESKAFKREEPLFVKNLENVQGDERDVILFSVGYGPNENGHVSMNFGPLNQTGGERRLNVALTRARDEMVVFSSLESDQIDPRRTKAEGALGLKRFLEYADKGQLTEAQLNNQCSSELLSQIISSLSSLGYTVHAGVGSSSFKVDLAVVDPSDPDRYCLGIIIDGDNYYKLKTVRDREVVRTFMLENLGWRLTRVWMLDWFLHPEQVIHHIQDCLLNS